MNNSDTSDLFASGISSWGACVRHGEISFRETVDNCLQRINDANTLNAFEHIDADPARASADALDQLLATGTDLGPLMGLPVGIKDIFSVNGQPLTNGSNAKTAHLSGDEGGVVRQLRAAGAILLGKTRTVEFALGATGVNESRGTPWNPVDREVHRIPGGSSSGSAVATAAGLVGIALGTDTGGSVRIPACFTGIVGHKTTVGLWPTNGIFPLSSTLDSVGPLCRTVHDAAIMHTLMSGSSVVPRSAVSGLRFGTPTTVFMEDLDEEVLQDFEFACEQLIKAGAIRVDMDFPAAAERTALFTSIVPTELLRNLTPAFFESIRGGVDSVTAARTAAGLSVSAIEYLQAQARRQTLAGEARATFDKVDCWMTPTCPILPMSLASLSDSANHDRALLASRNTQPGNLFDMCGISLPMSRGKLPTGLQMLMPNGHDTQLLSMAFAVEDMLHRF